METSILCRFWKSQSSRPGRWRRVLEPTEVLRFASCALVCFQALQRLQHQKAWKIGPHRRGRLATSAERTLQKVALTSVLEILICRKERLIKSFWCRNEAVQQKGGAPLRQGCLRAHARREILSCSCRPWAIFTQTLPGYIHVYIYRERYTYRYRYRYRFRFRDR